MRGKGKKQPRTQKQRLEAPVYIAALKKEIPSLELSS